MAEQSPKQYLTMLERSGLVPRLRLQEAIADLTQRSGSSPSLDQLSKYFIEAGSITAWHDEKLRAGKYRGFFLGKYKLLGFLGSGGMCSVYLAEHTILRQPRAIKVLPKGRTADKSYLDRFYREGRAAAALSHPNIVRVYDIDHDGDNHYLVLEYVEGMNLYELVKKNGPLNYRDATDYICQAAIGLQHAHDINLVHRDVKPANLLVTSGDIVKVLDLGLALFREEEYSVTLAHNEKVLGTADYLAPEQAVNSHDVDHRVDIYGLGCSLYYALTGKPPFPEGTLAQRIAMHQSKEPKSVEEFRPDCPKGLVRICQKMMQKNRDLRYQDCREVARDLRALQDESASQSAAATFTVKQDESRAVRRQNKAVEIASAPIVVATATKSDSKKILTAKPAVAVASGSPPPGTPRPSVVAANGVSVPKPTVAANMPIVVNGSARPTPDFQPDELRAIAPLNARRKRKMNKKQQLILFAIVAGLVLVLGVAFYLAIRLTTGGEEPAKSAIRSPRTDSAPGMIALAIIPFRADGNKSRPAESLSESKPV